MFVEREVANLINTGDYIFWAVLDRRPRRFIGWE
jgi:hypothetical protein